MASRAAGTVTWRPRKAAALAALTAALPIAAPALAEAQSDARQTVSDRFTTRIPGASAGRIFEVDFFDPADREAKPHAASRVFLELHPGARFDTTAIPQCEASDPQLMVQGADACPAESRVGTNVVVTDTGFPGPNRLITTDFVFLNNEEELILVGTERGSGARVVLRGRVKDNTLTIDIPPLPGAPPDGGANRSERAVFNEASTVRDGRRVAYLTTPPDCPASGRWTNQVTYTYRDGVEQTATSTSPCVPRFANDRRKPRVRVTGVPRGRCTAHSFRARVRASDESGLRRARLYLDGRRLRQTASGDFSKRIPAGRLPAGGHRVTASATDPAGNHSRTTVRFKRC